MSDHIVGMMWNKNEGDILMETITSALSHVDTLFIADDRSTDNSWDIIKSCAKRHTEIEHIQRAPDRSDKGQRQSLLNKIKERYDAASTWVQVIESDMMIAPFVDLRAAIQNNSVGGVAVYWKAWNAARPAGTWKEVDTYPNWQAPITEIMPLMHPMENMLYTFRPVVETTYAQNQRWRPWPQGLAKYLNGIHRREKYKANTPVTIHYGYRGPTHFYEKYKTMGRFHTKHTHWNLSSPETVEQTVDYFNGTWGKKLFEPTMEAYRRRKTHHVKPKNL